MSDLIERQDAIDAVAFGITYTKVFDKETGKVKVKELFAEGNYELKNAIDRIKELPSTEPKIIKCKDCKYMTEHYDTNGNAPYWTCYEWGSETDYDGFCHYAERKTDELGITN